MHCIHDLQEIETFTQSSWKELIERAQASLVPYYGIAVAYAYNPHTKHFVKKVYDAVSFDRYLRSARVDPVTRLEIKKVVYLCCKTSCYDINLKKLTINKKITFKRRYFNLDLANPSFVFEANNFIAKEKDATKVALCQYIVGQNLLKKSLSSRTQSPTKIEEALRWLTIAALSGCRSSQQLLEESLKRFHKIT